VITPEQFAQVDAEARRIVGKGIGECGWNDLEVIRITVQAEQTRLQADMDRAGAALAEVVDCDCLLEMPLTSDGQPDLGRARPRHVCGRGE
jgi:hypothetical protein